MRITMDQQWAQRKDPTKPVRLLSVGRWHDSHPVVYLDPFGVPCSATLEGLFCKGEIGDKDLVPLQQRVADVWVLVSNNGSVVRNLFDSEKAAKIWADGSGRRFTGYPYSVVRMTQYEEKS